MFGCFGVVEGPGEGPPTGPSLVRTALLTDAGVGTGSPGAVESDAPLAVIVRWRLVCSARREPRIWERGRRLEIAN